MKASLPAVFLLIGSAACHSARSISTYSADGRMSLDQLFGRYASLSADHGWQRETVYTYPDVGLPILSWRTARRGKALWILAGIHGEEPAGPNAIARALESISALADAGVPIVLLPLCNPKGYSNNWRYPNTPDRDWRKGGHSVGDAEYLLPDMDAGTSPRAAMPAGLDTEALTSYALKLTQDYPPLLVLDFHEDELSTEGGYIYSQGDPSTDKTVGAEVISLLRSSGIPIRLSGKTRFGETVVNGMISRDEKGRPVRDGSIDELLASARVFKNGKMIAGPAAPAVIVVETPAFAGSNIGQRIAAQSAVIARVGRLWQINPGAAR